MLKLSLLGCFLDLMQAAVILSPSTSLAVSQTRAIQSFDLWPDATQGDHWYVDLDFASSRLPDPAILSGSWRESRTEEEVKAAELLDFTGWYQRKSFHHLSLPIFNSSEVPFHLAVYLNLTSEFPVMNYTLTLHTSVTPICARNCSDHGLCETGQCLCRDGYGDELCDVLLLNIDQDQSLIVSSGQIWYFQALSLQSRKVIFEWTDGFPSIMTKDRGCGQRTALPSQYEHTDWYIATSNEGSYAVHTEDSKCASQLWTFRVAQSTSDPVVLFVRRSEEETGDSVDIMVIVIGVVGSLVGLAWIAFISWKIYARFHRKRVVVADLASASLLKMRKLCPKRRFRALSSPSEHPCAICLEEFTPQSEVRVLPCGHIYHEVCIDQWFLRNQSCCFCKMGIFQAKEASEMQVNDTAISVAAID